MLDLELFLDDESYYGEKRSQVIMRRVNQLIEEENIKMENTLYECVEMYCQTHGKIFNQDSINECIALLIEIGLTRHIIKNINNFTIYGYGYKKEGK